MSNVAIIIGTRPEAVKMAPVYIALRERIGASVRLISTGQHGEILRQTLDAFGLKPDMDLNVMKAGQSLSALTARLHTALEAMLAEDRPRLVLGHGDTTTCMVTAMSSFYHRVPFFHVEAGLRTHQLDSPFPEEFNRRVTAQVAKHHFAPTELERQNLIDEDVHSSSITIIGSTVHDAVRAMRSKGRNGFPLPARSGPVVVVTLHRRESVDALHHILQGIKLAARHRRDAVFVCPMHPNPNVQNAFMMCLQDEENVALTNPIEYASFISLIGQASLVITDSGGVQEEAAFLGKKVLLAREATERMDGMKGGLVTLAGREPIKLQKLIERELSRITPETEGKHETLPHLSASQLIAEKVMEVIQ